MTQEHVPAGWYPDPVEETASIRYWDGQSWTSQTQPMVNPAQYEGIGAPLTSPLAMYAPGQTIPDDLLTQPTKKDRKGFATAGFVLAIISVPLFCLSWVDAIIALLAIVFSVLGLRSSRKKMAIAGIIIGAIGLVAAILAYFMVLDMINDPVKYGLPADIFEGM